MKPEITGLMQRNATQPTLVDTDIDLRKAALIRQAERIGTEAITMAAVTQATASTGSST